MWLLLKLALTSALLLKPKVLSKLQKAIQKASGLICQEESETCS